MASKIQIRRDTAANWTSNNPILSLGEIGIESDTSCFKFGNGSTAWTSLTYGAINPTLYTALTSVADGDEIPIYDISSSTVSYVTAKNLYASLYSGRTPLTTLATNDTISVKDTSASDLGVITEANLANTLLANRTTSTSVDSTDLVPFYDVSASAGKTITTANLANNLHTNATEMTTLASNDTVCVYDTSATSVGQITVSNLETVINNQLLSSANTWTAEQLMIGVTKTPISTTTFTTTAVTYTYINICTLSAYATGSMLLRVFGTNMEDKLLIRFEQVLASEANNNFTVEYSKNSLSYGAMTIYSYVSSGVRTIYLGILPYDTSVNIRIYQDFNTNVGSITYNMTQSSSVPTYTFSQSLTAYPCGIITKQLIQQYDDTAWVDIKTTVSWDASLVTLSQAYIKRVGNTVNIKIGGTYNGGTITTNTALMTGALPTKYIPLLIAHGNNCTINSNSSFVARFYIQNDGIIYIGNTTMSSGTVFTWEITYLV